MLDLVHHKTHQRLLDVAAEVFAEHGFGPATVREICDRAGTNIAAVNYHFGDKEHLYAEVMSSGMRMLKEEILKETGQNALAPPRDRLELLLHSLLHHLQAGPRSSIYVTLISREVVEQTQALETVIAEVIRPVCKELESIVRELWGAAATERRVDLFCASVVSQCMAYFHCRSLLVRLYPNQPYSEDLKTLASNIIRCALGDIGEKTIEENLLIEREAVESDTNERDRCCRIGRSSRTASNIHGREQNTNHDR